MSWAGKIFTDGIIHLEVTTIPVGTYLTRLGRECLHLPDGTLKLN